MIFKEEVRIDTEQIKDTFFVAMRLIFGFKISLIEKDTLSMLFKNEAMPPLFRLETPKNKLESYVRLYFLLLS